MVRIILFSCILAFIFSVTAEPKENSKLTTPKNLGKFNQKNENLDATITRYDNQKLVRISNTPKIAKAIDSLNLDVWTHVDSKFLDVMANPKQLIKLKALAGARKNIKVINNDIQKLIDQTSLQMKQDAASENFFSNYHNYANLTAFYKEASEKFPDLVTFVPSIGKTSEGRDIPAVRVTSKTGDIAQKKRFWFQSLIHAREWITGSTNAYVFNDFVTNYKTGSENVQTSILDQAELIFIPIVNPDGYQFTWDNNRLWRKNRAVIDGSKLGVDLNRNFPEHWNEGGSSGSPESNTYRGPSAGSELETKAIMSYYLQFDNMYGAIDIHAYGQLILRPYGYTKEISQHDEKFKVLGDEIKEAIKSVRGKDYVNQNVIELYPASGIASDWFYGKDATQKNGFHSYGFSFELSPTGKEGFGGKGFVLPPDQIIPVGKDIVPAIQQFINYSIKNKLD